MKRKNPASLHILPTQAAFVAHGFTAPLDEPEPIAVTPCEYDYDPQCNTKLIDTALKHKHRPIILEMVTPKERILRELLQLNYLTGKARADATRFSNAPSDDRSETQQSATDRTRLRKRMEEFLL